MATKLGVFNGALRLCKERKLASLTENREPRRLLDDAWGDGSTVGAVRVCLEMGQWTFATKGIRLDYDPSIEPDFGFRKVFDQPSDMVRPVAICEDEYFQQPLLRYSDERRYWFADLDTIYVKYVSNASDYGADLSLWPENFTRLVEAYLAREIVGNLTGADSEKVEKAWEEAKKDSRSFDAMNKPTAFPPEGSWSASRRGSGRQSYFSGSWSS